MPYTKTQIIVNSVTMNTPTPTPSEQQRIRHFVYHAEQFDVLPCQIRNSSPLPEQKLLQRRSDSRAAISVIIPPRCTVEFRDPKDPTKGTWSEAVTIVYKGSSISAVHTPRDSNITVPIALSMAREMEKKTAA